MNLAIIGYGKMGHEVQKAAVLRGLNIISIIDPHAEGANFRQIDKKSLENVDVCIDFSVPLSVIENIKLVAALKKNMVVGTTGWSERLGDVGKIVDENGIGLVYASNFSIGVNAFFSIVEKACIVMDKLDDYEAFCLEMHHSKKLDSPSGTAKTLAGIMEKNIKRIQNKKLDIASVRSGSIPGTHVVGFDSKADTIELKHTARNREGFASGAIMAAQWILNKKGLYSINDMMKNILGD